MASNASVPASDAAAPSSPSGSTAEPGRSSDSYRLLLREAYAMASYARHFAAAQVDALRVQVRNVVLYMAAGVVGLVVFIAIVISFWVYLLRGIAGGLAAAFGPEWAWLADITAGVLGLGGIAAAILITSRVLRSKFRRERIVKYDRRKAQQRARYGRDIKQAARAA